MTEFWMVHSLARHPGHVKNRDQLMRDANMVVDDGTITSHVKRIRKKFLAVDRLSTRSRRSTEWGTAGRSRREAPRRARPRRGGVDGKRGRRGRRWYLQVDNDVAFGTDRWYTSGIRFACVKRDFELAIVHEVYTPDAKHWSPGTIDRAPAARLLASAARHDRDDAFFQTIELAAGVRGPAALGRQSTEAIHRLIPAPEVDWSRQLENRFDIQLAIARSQVLADHLKAHFGTVAETRWPSLMRDSSFARGQTPPFRARSCDSPPLRPLPQAAPHTGWDTYAGASVRAVGRNALLSRDYDPFGPPLERRRAVGRLVAGVAWSQAWGSVRFELAQDSREFTAQSAPHRFGSLVDPPRFLEPLAKVRASFIHGIRFRLVMAALVLLALPWLAAQFIVRMETFLRNSQEQAIGATARAVAAALSDRPQLFRAADDPNDRAGEERRRIVALFAAADTDAAASLGNAYIPSEEIERFLAIMGRRSSRVWVVDTRSRVRGLSGALREGAASARELTSWLKPLAALVVPTPGVPAGDESQPARGQFDRALIGVSSTQWRAERERDVAILSAAQPIFVGDDIVGAVVVEETGGSIQLLKQSALENLLAVTLAVVAAALAILLAFATRLTTRIRRLHAEAESAIDPQGRVRGAITPTAARDEIGDLTRTTAAVLALLKDYNAYLEAMASRLSHELRTPVAVVRSSLDNLKAQALPEEARVYVERAGEGVERLARVISRGPEGHAPGALP